MSRRESHLLQSNFSTIIMMKSNFLLPRMHNISLIVYSLRCVVHEDNEYTVLKSYRSNLRRLHKMKYDR